MTKTAILNAREVLPALFQHTSTALGSPNAQVEDAVARLRVAHVAVVGVSGAGKSKCLSSTLSRLLADEGVPAKVALPTAQSMHGTQVDTTIVYSPTMYVQLKYLSPAELQLRAAQAARLTNNFTLSSEALRSHHAIKQLEHSLQPFGCPPHGPHCYQPASATNLLLSATEVFGPDAAGLQLPQALHLPQEQQLRVQQGSYRFLLNSTLPAAEQSRQVSDFLKREARYECQRHRGRGQAAGAQGAWQEDGNRYAGLIKEVEIGLPAAALRGLRLQDLMGEAPTLDDAEMDSNQAKLLAADAVVLVLKAGDNRTDQLVGAFQINLIASGVFESWLQSYIKGSASLGSSGGLNPVPVLIVLNMVHLAEDEEELKDHCIMELEKQLRCYLQTSRHAEVVKQTWQEDQQRKGASSEEVEDEGAVLRMVSEELVEWYVALETVPQVDTGLPKEVLSEWLAKCSKEERGEGWWRDEGSKLVWEAAQDMGAEQLLQAQLVLKGVDATEAWHEQLLLESARLGTSLKLFLDSQAPALKAELAASIKQEVVRWVAEVTEPCCTEEDCMLSLLRPLLDDRKYVQLEKAMRRRLDLTQEDSWQDLLSLSPASAHTIAGRLTCTAVRTGDGTLPPVKLWQLLLPALATMGARVLDSKELEYVPTTCGTRQTCADRIADSYRPPWMQRLWQQAIAAAAGGDMVEEVVLPEERLAQSLLVRAVEADVAQKLQGMVDRLQTDRQVAVDRVQQEVHRQLAKDIMVAYQELHAGAPGAKFDSDTNLFRKLSILARVATRVQATVKTQLWSLAERAQQHFQHLLVMVQEVSSSLHGRTADSNHFCIEILQPNTVQQVLVNRVRLLVLKEVAELAKGSYSNAAGRAAEAGPDGPSTSTRAAAASGTMPAGVQGAVRQLVEAALAPSAVGRELEDEDRLAMLQEGPAKLLELNFWRLKLCYEQLDGRHGASGLLTAGAAWRLPTGPAWEDIVRHIQGSVEAAAGRSGKAAPKPEVLKNTCEVMAMAFGNGSPVPRATGADGSEGSIEWLLRTAQAVTPEATYEAQVLHLVDKYDLAFPDPKPDQVLLEASVQQLQEERLAVLRALGAVDEKFDWLQQAIRDIKQPQKQKLAFLEKAAFTYNSKVCKHDFAGTICKSAGDLEAALVWDNKILLGVSSTRTRSKQGESTPQGQQAEQQHTPVHGDVHMLKLGSVLKDHVPVADDLYGAGSLGQPYKCIFGCVVGMEEKLVAAAEMGPAAGGDAGAGGSGGAVDRLRQAAGRAGASQSSGEATQIQWLVEIKWVEPIPDLQASAGEPKFKWKVERVETALLEDVRAIATGLRLLPSGQPAVTEEQLEKFFKEAQLKAHSTRRFLNKVQQELDPLLNPQMVDAVLQHMNTTPTAFISATIRSCVELFFRRACCNTC